MLSLTHDSSNAVQKSQKVFELCSPICKRQQIFTGLNSIELKLASGILAIVVEYSYDPEDIFEYILDMELDGETIGSEVITTGNTHFFHHSYLNGQCALISKSDTTICPLTYRRNIESRLESTKAEIDYKPGGKAYLQAKEHFESHF